MTDADQLARTIRAQLLTCTCCKVAYSTPLELRAHLLEVAKNVAAKLAELEKAGV